MSKMPPCLNCQDRVLGCHSTCLEYLEFRRERDELLEKKQQEKPFWRGHEVSNSRQEVI